MKVVPFVLSCLLGEAARARRSIMSQYLGANSSGEQPPFEFKDEERAPKLTEEQRQRMDEIKAHSKKASAKAKKWLEDHLVEHKGELKDWAKDLSTEQLIERLEWEYPRLHIFRNTWLLEEFIEDGYLPNQCHQWVTGNKYEKNKLWGNGYGYLRDMTKLYGLREFPDMDKMTLRDANECIFYNANALLKRNAMFHYGFVGWAFNPKAMKDRYFLEPWDIGMVHSKGNIPDNYPDYFGSMEDYFHTLQGWHEMMKVKQEQHNTLATVMNHWYAPGDKLVGGLKEAPYNEYMIFGSVHFEADLLYALAEPELVPRGEKDCLWGTKRGSQFQEAIHKMSKPLLWSGYLSGRDVGFLDPHVGGVAGGLLDDGKKWFDQAWGKKCQKIWQLMKPATKSLRFRYQSFTEKQICEAPEKDPQNNIMGYNGNNKCVYWTDFKKPTKWECLNDGTCTLSSSGAAKYSSEKECMAKCGNSKWTCITKPPPAKDEDGRIYNKNPHYCLPQADGKCENLESCEGTCGSGSC